MSPFACLPDGTPLESAFTRMRTARQQVHQAVGVLEDLSAFRIPALILSGGEPLSRFDFWELAERARQLDFRHLSLSTNGTKLGEAGVADRVAALGFDYVGISLDGIGATNDWFRGVEGAFANALAGVRACKARGVKVGLRFTITRDNGDQLLQMLDLCESEGVDKFYLSHLVYAGRGDKHRGEDQEHAHTRRAMDLLIERGWDDLVRLAAAEGATLHQPALVSKAITRLVFAAGASAILVMGFPVLLQATSPVRRPDTIRRALAMFREKGVDALVGVVPESPFFWRLPETPGQSARAALAGFAVAGAWRGAPRPVEAGGDGLRGLRGAGPGPGPAADRGGCGFR